MSEHANAALMQALLNHSESLVEGLGSVSDEQLAELGAVIDLQRLAGVFERMAKVLKPDPNRSLVYVSERDLKQILDIKGTILRVWHEPETGELWILSEGPDCKYWVSANGGRPDPESRTVQQVAAHLAGVDKAA